MSKAFLVLLVLIGLVFMLAIYGGSRLVEYFDYIKCVKSHVETRDDSLIIGDFLMPTTNKTTVCDVWQKDVK